MLRISFIFFILVPFFGWNQSFSQSTDTLIEQFMQDGNIPGVLWQLFKETPFFSEEVTGFRI
jgi:hypothetical protein